MLCVWLHKLPNTQQSKCGPNRFGFFCGGDHSYWQWFSSPCHRIQINFLSWILKGTLCVCLCVCSVCLHGVSVGCGGCCLWLGTCEQSWHSPASCYGCGSPVAAAALENAVSLPPQNEKWQSLLENLYNAPTHHRKREKEWPNLPQSYVHYSLCVSL